MKGKKIWRWIKIAIVAYCLIGIIFYYLQDYIFFKPVALPSNYVFNFDIPHRDISIPYSKNSSMNVVQFSTADSAKGVVLYFHGNAKNIARYAPYAPHFTGNNYEVWMLDYPGFGKSIGEFTEQRLYDWALTFYQLARAKYEPGEIIIYGRSLGSGIASQLASVRDCRTLILETPYYSFPSLVKQYLPIYPVNAMVHYKLPTWQYLKQVTAPVVVFHGTDDWTIPYRNAKRLVPYLKPTDEFVTIEEGEHNNLDEFPVYTQKLDSILR